MNRVINWLFRLLRVPTEAPAPAEGAAVLEVRQPGPQLLRLQLVTWFVMELGGALFFLALLLTSDVPLLPNFIEDWLRRVIDEGFWVSFFDETPGWLARLLDLNPIDLTPKTILYGFIAQALFSLLMILSKLKIRTSWFLVDERGIRTRTGLFTIQEKNADFTRIQSLHLNSSILQGFFGLADIELHTASASNNTENKQETTLAFRNIDRAREVYGLIQTRLLKTVEQAEAPVKETADPSLSAARSLLSEVQALRAGFE